MYELHQRQLLGRLLWISAAAMVAWPVATVIWCKSPHYVAGRIEAKHRFTLMTVNTKCTRLCALSTQGGRKLRSDCTAEGNIEAVNARSEFLWADAGQPRLARTGGISGHRSRGSRLFA